MSALKITPAIKNFCMQELGSDRSGSDDYYRSQLVGGLMNGTIESADIVRAEVAGWLDEAGANEIPVSYHLRQWCVETLNFPPHGDNKYFTYRLLKALKSGEADVNTVIRLQVGEERFLEWATKQSSARHA